MHVIEWKRYSPDGDYVETVKESIPSGELVTVYRLLSDLNRMNVKYTHRFIE